MKRWFVVLMMLVLPLRGLVGDAMAGDMLATHLAGAGAPSHAVAAAPHDCAQHGTMPMTHGADPSNPADAPLQSESDCSTCASCQACSAVALALPPVALALAATGATEPASVERRFASVVPARGIKPPIS